MVPTSPALSRLGGLCRESGMSLIEVLVALLILSIGLLGIAGLQLNSLRANTGSYWQSQATWLAYDMSDRIRANPVGTGLGHYDNLDTKGASDQGCITSANGCAGTALANQDAYEWGLRLANLPGGRGLVTASGTTDLIVTVMWDDQRTGATGTNCSGDPAVDLTCFSLTVRK